MIKTSSENYEKFCIITKDIDYKLLSIKKDTMFSSNFSTTINHPQFKELSNMGTKIIPYIFHVGTHTGFSWTHLLLLQDITKQSPVLPEHAGLFYHQIIYWMNWYLNSNYYLDKDLSDVYYGLVS